MFNKIGRSWELTKQSFAILADNKSLMVFPILSATATLVVMASFIFPVYTSGAYRHVGGQRTPTDYLLLFAFYFVCYFVQIFFNCALMASANQAFCGGKANVSDGLGMAWARLPQIIMYAAFAATVGMILRTLEERVGLVGRIIIRVLGVTWSVMTYFIAPVIVFEGLGAFEGVNRSAGLIKKTWGESLVSGLSWIAVTLMMVLAGVVAFVGMLFYAISTRSAPGMLVGFGLIVAYFLMIATVISTLDGIYRVALYRYASWGVVPAGYSPELIQGAFAVKEKKGWLN